MNRRGVAASSVFRRCKANLSDEGGRIRAPDTPQLAVGRFILDRKVNKEFIERFKPFGKIESFSDELGKGFLVKDEATDTPLFVVKVVGDTSLLVKESSIDPNWNLGEEFLCVDILTSRNSRYLLQAIERQIRKFQACVLCGACVGICPTNAITINPHLRVSEDKCCHCRNLSSTSVYWSNCPGVSLTLRRS